jgi:hypothetical protein
MPVSLWVELRCCLWGEERQRTRTTGRTSKKNRLTIMLSQGAIASLDHLKGEPFWHLQA